MNKEEFKKWYIDTIKPQGGSLYAPSFLYDRCTESHKALNNKYLAGESSRTEKICTSDWITGISAEKAREYFDAISKINHRYIYDHGINPAFFRNKQCRGINVTKHLRVNAAAKCDPINKPILEAIINALDQEYAKVTSKEKELFVTISTSPEAFVNLGHYACDRVRGSCFIQRGANDKHKYYLALSQNTFVMLIGSDKESVTKNDNSLLCRLWGVANHDLTDFNVCNFYYNDGVDQGSVHIPVPLFFERLFGTEATKLENIFTVRNIYFNPGNRWTLFPKETRGPDITEFDLYPKTLSRLLLCGVCNMHLEPEGLSRTADGYYACKECYEKLPTCAISLQKVAKAIQAIIDDSDKLVTIGCNHKVGICCFTNKVYLYTLLKKMASGYSYYPKNLQDKHLCKKCKSPFLEFETYKHCPVCREIMKIERYEKAMAKAKDTIKAEIVETDKI